MKRGIRIASFLFSFALSLISIVVQGQSNVERMINNLAFIEDEKRTVDTLNEIAWVLRKRERDPRGLQYAKDANTLALTQDYPKGLGDSYARLGLIYYYQGKYDPAIAAFKQALELRQRLEDHRGTAGIYLNIGNSYQENFDPQRAISAFREGLAILNERQNIPSIRAKLCNAMGISFMELGRMDSASVFINQSLEIRRSRNDFKSMPNSLMELGSIYRRQGLHTNALNSYFEALKYAIRSNDSIQMAQSFTGIGNVYLELERFDSSQVYLERSYIINEKLDRRKGLGIFHNNMGKLMLMMGEYHQAGVHLDEALKIRTSLIDTLGLAITENLLGDLYLESGNPERAIIHFNNSDNYTDVNKNPLNTIDLYQKMGEAYNRIDAFEQAVEVLTKSIAIKTGLQANYEKANDLQLSLEKEKAEKAIRERKIQELEHEVSLNQAYAIIITVIAVCIFLFLLTQVQKRKNQITERERIIAEGKKLIAEQKEKLAQQKISDLLTEIELRSNYAQIAGENSERKRISQDLHDRVGSMLATVKFLLTAFLKNLPELPSKKMQQYQEANEVLVETSEEVRRISHNLHSNRIKASGLVKQLEVMAGRIQAAALINVDVDTHKITDRFDLNQEIAIYRIIQELVGNVLKHAKAKHLTIQLSRLNGVLNIIIEDDGKGFNRKKLEENKSGIGLSNVVKRVHSLNGKLRIDSGKGAGTTISIDIPVNSAEEVSNEALK